MPNLVKILKPQLAQSLGSPCADGIPASVIEQILAEDSVRYPSRLGRPPLWGRCPVLAVVIGGIAIATQLLFFDQGQ